MFTFVTNNRNSVRYSENPTITAKPVINVNPAFVTVRLQH